MTTKKINIGLFGFGCVGQGLYHVLNNSSGFKANISKIVVKNKNKERLLAKELISYDKQGILDDGNIDVVVELIDDATEAFLIVREAMQKGKHVVTANKKMLAYHMDELNELQKKHNVSLLYEGSVCGSIPIIRTLEEYFDNEELDKISGIFNGTSNYILTKTINDKLSYQNALAQAQEKGFAESDPTNDVEGYDPKFKAIIVVLHAFGLIIKPESVLNIGITTLTNDDINYASEKGYKIKLTPVIQRVAENKITAFVLPHYVKDTNHLFNVENEFNGVILEGRFSGEQFMQGRGAGSFPTGAAVLSDISALSHGYRYEFKKHVQNHTTEYTNDVLLKVYLRYNDAKDLERIPFNEITEKYTGVDYNYIVGKVNLTLLLKEREYIMKNNLFVSLLSDNAILN